MTKQHGLRWLPAMLLALILYPTFARQANAQVDTTYNVGDIVEFRSVSEPNVWMKGKIATKCIGETCGVLKWSDYTNGWMDGSIYTYPSNIRRPGAHQSALPQQAPPQASANAQVATTYKIGDRIDLLAGSSQLGGKNVGGTWQPGTIVNVAQTANDTMYYVLYNENQHYWASSSQVRARTGLISESAKVRSELAALGALKAPQAGSFDEIFQNLIRENCERQGGIFPVTVTFQGFVIGKTHLYSRPDVYGESADGPGGTANTTVYPVRAQYYFRIAQTDAFLIQRHDEVFNCFKNAFGKWQCNPGSGGKGMIRHLEERRAG